jgi:hypothetical protein
MTEQEIEELIAERDSWKYFATRLIAYAHEQQRTKVEGYSGLSKDLIRIFRTDI